MINKDINPQYYILNVGRWQKDFEYVFTEVKVLGYVSNNAKKDTWMGKSLKSLSDYLEEKTDEDMLIVCSSQDREIQDGLKKNGLEHGKDWIWAEDMFYLLDELSWAGSHYGVPVLVWGTGSMAEKFWKLSADYYQIKGFLDNNKNRESFHNLPVISPYTDDSWHKYPIIVATYQYDEIKKQLLDAGLKEDQFVYFKNAIPVSFYMRKAWNDRNKYNLVCHSMLSNIDLSMGDCYPCCSTFMLDEIGDVLTQSFDEIWGGALHRIFNMATLNKSFAFCRKDLCPALVNKSPQTYRENYDEEAYPAISKHAKVGNLAFDYSCNLYCESCRQEIRTAKKADCEKINRCRDVALNNIVPHLSFLTMAGNGEVFLSPAYRDIWASSFSKDCKYFQILSNGTLITEEKWEQLTENRKSILLCCISIDAATEVTYNKLRRGGNWHRLLRNIDFLSKKRKSGELSYLRLNFVVQRMNYQEIPSFIEWAKKINVDRVLFTKILNWGTYDNEEFENISMVDDEGNPKKELQKILESPICQDDIVDIGTFFGKHRYEDTDFVEDYYLWEINNYSNLNISKT